MSNVCAMCGAEICDEWRFLVSVKSWEHAKIDKPIVKTHSTTSEICPSCQGRINRIAATQGWRDEPDAFGNTTSKELFKGTIWEYIEQKDGGYSPQFFCDETECAKSAYSCYECPMSKRQIAIILLPEENP